MNTDDYLISIENKLTDVSNKLAEISIAVALLKENKGDFRFHFGLIWSAIGGLFLVLLGLLGAKIV